MNTLGIKLYFSENDDDDDYCQTDKTLNIGNIPEMLSEKVNQAWETSPQATLISLWLCGKFACHDLCCDWP